MFHFRHDETLHYFGTFGYASGTLSLASQLMESSKSLLKNEVSLVGRGFSRDVSRAKSAGLQPLKFPPRIFSTSR